MVLVIQHKWLQITAVQESLFFSSLMVWSGLWSARSSLVPYTDPYECSATMELVDRKDDLLACFFFYIQHNTGHPLYPPLIDLWLSSLQQISLWADQSHDENQWKRVCGCDRLQPLSAAAWRDWASEWCEADGMSSVLIEQINPYIRHN